MCVTECLICLEDFSIPVKLDCGHTFDLDCILKWFKHNATCPIDRKNINGMESITKNCHKLEFRFLSNTKIKPLYVKSNVICGQIQNILWSCFYIMNASNDPYSIKNKYKQRKYSFSFVVKGHSFKDDVTLEEFIKNNNFDDQDYTICVVLY